MAVFVCVCVHIMNFWMMNVMMKCKYLSVCHDEQIHEWGVIAEWFDNHTTEGGLEHGENMMFTGQNVF